MGRDVSNDSFTPYRPTHEQIDELIERAQEHPLGIDYLLNGYLDSVSATFQVHAFVVDDARHRISGRRGPSEPLL